MENLLKFQIEHNGSPADPQQFEALQKHLESVNKAKEEAVLAEAQKQAQAHLQAQHEAIANAQKQAQEAAYAKIAAHNQGLTTLKHPEQQQQVSALQARPLEQVLANPMKHQYGGAYSSSEEDLRNAKPQIQYLTATPPLYNANDLPQINYSPVSPYTPHLVQEVVTTPKSVVILQPPQELVTVNVAEHDDVSFLSKRRRRGINISLDPNGRVVVTDLNNVVQRRKNDDTTKNIIVINNSNTNQKIKNILHVPQYFKATNPPKVFPNYKKVIPKILRAEHKVQVALRKVG